MRESIWLLRGALEEDGVSRDRTTEALFGDAAPGAGRTARASFVPRCDGVLCGLPVVAELLRIQAPELALTTDQRDGDRLLAGRPFAEISGAARSILPVERIALNILGRLSGIATLTARWVEEVAGTAARILDTRKTTPGWRYLEKYAVRSGGGHNHRMSLADGVLVKDNHLAILAGTGARYDLKRCVDELRLAVPDAFLEIEVDGREQFSSLLETDVDAILLDNFPPDEVRWAVDTRNHMGRARPLLEASGGVCLETLRALAETGVERISAGALTHSAVWLDIGLDYARPHGA